MNSVPRKVLVLSPWVSREGGGLQSSVRDLIDACHEVGGFEYQVISTKDAHSGSDALDWKSSQPLVFRYYGPDSFRLSPGLLYGSLTTDVELVQLHGIWMFPSLAAGLVARIKRKPLIISPHGMLDPWIRARSRFKKAPAELIWERSNWSRATALRALNESEADAVRSVAPSTPIAVIPNGVKMPSPPADVERSPDHLRYLLFLGRMHEKKGVMNLIRAWSIFKSRNPNDPLRLVVCGWGEGSYVERCVSLAKSLNLQDSVEFRGPVFGSEKDRALRNCDGLVLPSLGEGLPVAVLESWSYAKPTLMTRECNLPIGFERGCSLEINSDAESIAHGIESFAMCDSSSYRTMQLRAVQLVGERFQWEGVAKRFVALQAWALGGGARPDFVIV